MAAVTDGAILPSGPLMPGQRLGRYEVLAKLASGGMAIVYIARAQGAAGFERIVALKVLHANLAYEEEFIRMFLDEARLAARIRHPNVVPTIDISDSLQTGFYLVMEYIDGDHLGALLTGAHKAGSSMPVPVVLRIIVDALNGLAAAHDLRDDGGRLLQLVHRDVSPHNILVGRDGVARLTDFGVAKAEDRLTHTRDGQVKGKLAYMAPEQAATGACDARSDLFSMGVIAWECLTGRRLFRADSTAATLTKLLSEEIAPPSAIDEALAPLDAVMRKALDREPSRRFQSAEQFIEALENAARYYGGLASRRAVTKVVEQFAAEKLARDRARIVHAQQLLRGGTPGADGGPEPSLPPSELSDVSASRSRPSRVFSHLTAPALFTRRRSTRPSHATPPDVGVGAFTPAAAPLAPPPPLGSLESLDLPIVPDAMASPRDSGLGRALLLGLLAIGVLAAAYVLWSVRQSESSQSVVATPLDNAAQAPDPQQPAQLPSTALAPPVPPAPTEQKQPAARDSVAPAAPTVAAAEPSVASPPEPATDVDAPTNAAHVQRPRTGAPGASHTPRAQPAAKPGSSATPGSASPSPPASSPVPAAQTAPAPVPKADPNLLPNPYTR